MTTINDLFGRRDTGPLQKPLRVVVVASDEANTYRGQDGTLKRCLSVAISDGMTCLLCKVFDELKFTKFAVGTSVVLRDVIQKTEDSRHIVVTKNTKVFVTSKIACPDEHVTEGQALINPPPADVVSLPAALASPPKKKVSVRGRLIQEEAKRTVKVRGEDVDIRVVTLEENQVRAKVTLWRDATELSVKAGDYVSITDVVVNMFKGEASLSSTSRSKVEASEAPLQKFTASIEGVDVGGETVDLLTSEGDVLCVEQDVLRSCIGEDDIEAFFIVHVPVQMKIFRRGSTIEACALC